ncbi:MAG: MFS transporter, partial [Pseudomonadota bacterium]
MAFIDGSALTVALPALKQEFGGNVSVVQWVLNGYVLALAALTMIGGAMADAFGRARILMWGTTAFALASAACALAPSSLILICARVAQGVAAALVTPASLALIGELFAKDDRGRAIGIWAGASSLAAAGGPILGGWLVETLSWRAVFWINLPLAALALLLLTGLPKRRGDAEGQFDVLGSVLLALALCAVAFALSAIAPTENAAGHDAGDANWLLSGLMFSAAGALLLAFWIWQGRATHPLLPRYIFTSRTFAGLNVATIGLYTGLSIVFFLLPFELIERRGMTAVEAGLVFLPFTLCVAFLSKRFGQLADRVGLRRMLIAGSLLAAIGFAAFATDPSNVA